MSFGGQGQVPSDVEQQIAFKMMFTVMKSCFGDCVTDFRGSEFSSSEKTCMSNCAQRIGKTQGILASAQQEMATKMGG